MASSHLNDWVTVSEVPRLVELETGRKITRQTVYNWIRRKWLKVGPFKPLRTTRGNIMTCLNDHMRIG